MDDFKGTPGPWHWDEEGLGNKNHIVFGKEYPAEMTSKANKALITAAPELLEACLRLRNQLYAAGYDSKENSLNPTEDILFQTEKAIAKALGKE